MVSKKTVFALTVLISIFAVLLTIAVIAIAIFFRKLRKKIEEEIKAEKPKGNEIVAKMTVKARKKENKYSKSNKRNYEREPQFYESPPMRDEHREIFQMKALQTEDVCMSQNFSRDQVTQVAASSKVFRHANTMRCPLDVEDPYIECILDDEDLPKMTTFQKVSASSNRKSVTQAPGMPKSHATTLPRTLERDEIDSECIRRAKPSHGATLPGHTSFPIKQDHGHGFKGALRDHVTQQQVSRNANFTSKNDHCDGEMYEHMENNEFYENTGFVSNEDFYGNQEIIEQENKRRSQTNMAQLPHHFRNWNSETARSQEENYGEEVYENQEIVEQQRREKTQRSGTHNFELYENYVSEEMYENC